MPLDKKTLLLPWYFIRDEVTAFFQSFMQMSWHVLILKLSLLFVFFFSKSDYALHFPLKILSLYMIIADGLILRRGLWIILVVAHLGILFSQWDYIDNHKYISVYWLIACTLSLYSSRPEELLKFNAAFIIAMAFMMATIQKLIGGQYLDGSFLHFTFLTDSRFEIPVGLWGQLTTDILPANYKLLDEYVDFPNMFNNPLLKTNGRIEQLAWWVSLWTLVVEFLIGVLFFWSLKSSRGRQFKDYVLLYFMISTYSVVMVSGFNFLLILLGLAQTNKQDRITALLYLIGLMIFESRQIPWFKYLSHFL